MFRDSIFKLSEDDFRELIKQSSNMSDVFSASCSPQINNTYEVFLSNGERIKINFDETHIPHLLGFKNLSNLDDKSKSSLRVYREMMANEDYREKIIKKIKDNNWEFSAYMSKQYDLKIKHIQNAIRAPFPKEVYFVCKYNSESNISSGSFKNYSTCDYYIGKKELNGDISLIGLVNNGQYYAPRTNRVFLKMNANEELEELLKNQKICYINSLRIYTPIKADTPSTIHLYNSDKMDVLQSLITLSNKTGAIVDCAGGYLYDLKIKEEEKLLRVNVVEKIEEIAVSVGNGSIIEEDENIDKFGPYKDVINHLSDAINNRLCSPKKNDSAEVSFTKLRNDFKKLTKEVAIFQSKISKEEEKNKELEKTIREIKKEKEDLEVYKKKADKKIKKYELLINEKKEDE